MSEVIFAFGSNMCSGRLRGYGPGSMSRGRAALLGTASTLDGRWLLVTLRRADRSQMSI
jgi:hypothetical protein